MKEWIVGKKMAFIGALFLLQKLFFGLQSPLLALENCQKQSWPWNSEVPSAKVRGKVSVPARNIFLFLLLLLQCSKGFSSTPWLRRWQQSQGNNEEIYSLVFWQLLNKVLLRSCLYLFYLLWRFLWKTVGVKCLLKRILAGNYFWTVFMINLIKKSFSHCKISWLMIASKVKKQKQNKSVC